MAKRRRKIKRPQPAWKSAIGFSVGVHAFIILCLIGVGWRYLNQDMPGLPILIHEVIVGDDEPSGGAPIIAPTNRPSTPRTAITRNTTTSSESSATGESNTDIGNGAGNQSSNGNGSGSGMAGDPTLAEIRRRIERAKRYPAVAREQHVEGRVGVQFNIRSDGQVHNVHVTQSSGSHALDDAAIAAIQDSVPLPYYGNAINLSLAFRLR